ncbi:putative DNA primase subunit Pri1 [Sphaerosporella brunnea]|uniref:DNA primase n=1 Tax=Sphaerosporella brunnea TaxID=1250544 RepID=A0A5J5F1L3_9PEZI|nr:putative DNA primase subunit Pri1 [Sphaerosporella brunnea]
MSGFDHLPAEELPDAPPAGASADEALDNGSEARMADHSPRAKVEALSSPPPAFDLDDQDTKASKGDEDEDYGDSPDIDGPQLEVSLPPAKSSDYSDPEVMRAFYQRLFPWRLLFQWLNHSPIPSHDFTDREFAFTRQNGAYLRYQSFPNFETLRKEVLEFNPSRFEIGPVYSANPRDRKSLRKAAFKPVAKELVFDIDLTDYDDVRTCCDKANICNKCWQFVTVAIKIVDTALREDFGFKHIMWVYSGRRGAHAWVCDKRARVMDDQKRRAIASYLEVVRGGDKSGKKVNLRRPLHPHQVRSMDVLKDSFAQNILRDQDPWRGSDQAERLLDLLPDKNLITELRRTWQSLPGRSSTEKWNDIDTTASKGTNKTLDTQKLRDAKQDIVFEYLYPRLDVEVSKHLNHLLKSPFVVHPGTGRVCVPIDAERPEEFDPLSVPTVTELIREIDEWDLEHKPDEKEDSSIIEVKTPDFDKTSLKPYVEYFRRFVAMVVREETLNQVKVKRERGAEHEAMEF